MFLYQYIHICLNQSKFYSLFWTNSQRLIQHAPVTLHRQLPQLAVSRGMPDTTCFLKLWRKWNEVKVVVLNIFYFHPYLVTWSNLTNVFQMGWNHQLAKLHFESVGWYFDIGWDQKLYHPDAIYMSSHKEFCGYLKPQQGVFLVPCSNRRQMIWWSNLSM